MVDAIVPFDETLSSLISRGERLDAALSGASTAASEAAAQTASLTPRKGRARPLAERSIGHPDPGAVSFALIVTAIAEYATPEQ